MTFRIAAAHPHLRYIVQDREGTIAIAPKAWDDQQKEVFSSGRISFQAQDFFTPQPAVYQVPGVGEVKHPSVFVVTRVMHNWGDEECKKYVRIPFDEDVLSLLEADTALYLQDPRAPPDGGGPRYEALDRRPSFASCLR